MKIVNLRTNHILSTNAQHLHSLKEKTFGLLDTKVSRSLMFKTRFGIHTFGLTDAIDVLILDSGQVVRKIRRSLKPNEMFFWNPLFDWVLELPAGTILGSKTKVGDQLQIV